MKRWQIVWLAIVLIWGTVLFWTLAVSFLTGGVAVPVGRVVMNCFIGFTLPATGLYMALALLAWAGNRTKTAT